MFSSDSGEVKQVVSLRPALRQAVLWTTDPGARRCVPSNVLETYPRGPLPHQGWLTHPTAQGKCFPRCSASGFLGRPSPRLSLSSLPSLSTRPHESPRCFSSWKFTSTSSNFLSLKMLLKNVIFISAQLTFFLPCSEKKSKNKPRLLLKL